jgi:precorrin-6B methylase 1
VGLLNRTRETTSRWKDKGAGDDLRHDLKEAIARRLAANIRTGEVDEMTRGVVRLALDAAFEVIPAFSSVKAPARKLGVDIEDYRDFGVRYRVQVLPEGAHADE